MKTRPSTASACAIAFCFFFFPVHSGAQENSADLASRLPFDAAVDSGTLGNGIRYYVRANRKPEKRAEFRLAVNVGSVLEDEDQKGLAHFTEHMAFNGTRDFKKQELINYIESIGMRFGADLNAYTSFDETVYMLQVPTDSSSILEKGIDILENWAHLVSFDDDEIDKERGVVIEEWRLGRGADARMRDKQFPILFKGSRYADRLPIGDKQLLETFGHDTLRKFYHDWYRPDLMAVIAVGDFDTARVASLIRKHFSTIPVPTVERKRTRFSVPDQNSTLYAIASDPEATLSRVGLYFKHDVEPESTTVDYRRQIVEALYNGMLNVRLNELTQQADPPFLGATSFNGQLVRTKGFYYLGATVKGDGIPRGLDVLMTEALRIRKYGFNQTELDRMKDEMLRSIQRAYEERDKTESYSYAGEYIRNFLEDEPSPGIAYEYDLYKRFIPGISLQDVNRLAARWVTDDNRVAVVSSPQKPGLTIPTEHELAQVIASASGKPLKPYIDRTSNEPLVPAPPQPGSIVSSTENKDLGTFTWELSNGVRVILKPTDFKNDQVLFTAFRPGGTSLAPDSTFISAAMASSIVAEAGIGHFDNVELQKKLAGKIVSIMPGIRDLDENLSGNASPKDLPTLFELIYLYCTAPRTDSTSFASLLSRYKSFLENRSARPESAFEDTVQVTLAQHHVRARPLTSQVLDEMHLRQAVDFYRARFGDADNFTFIFVGSFALNDIRPLILTYLGGLPFVHTGETWKDIGLRYPTGVIEKTVTRGIEPKSQVRIIFTGPFDWDAEQVHDISSLAFILREKLREQIREEKGGTYGVSVGANPRRYPWPQYSFTISFGCAPDRVDELTRDVFNVIDSLRHFGPDTGYIQKTRETQMREHETNLKQNSPWLSWLQTFLMNGMDPEEILNFGKRVNSLSTESMKETAVRYLHEDRYVKVVLLPQGKP